MHEAGDAHHDRALTVAIGADQRDAVALGDLEAHIVDGSDSAVGDR